jgi:hypothetical protein
MFGTSTLNHGIEKAGFDVEFTPLIYSTSEYSPHDRRAYPDLSVESQGT